MRYYHSFVAQVSVPLSIDYPQKTFDINVEGTQNIIDAAHKFGIKRLIIASSAAVYGEVFNLPLKGRIRRTMPFSLCSIKVEKRITGNVGEMMVLKRLHYDFFSMSTL